MGMVEVGMGMSVEKVEAKRTGGRKGMREGKETRGGSSQVLDVLVSGEKARLMAASTCAPDRTCSSDPLVASIKS